MPREFVENLQDQIAPQPRKVLVDNLDGPQGIPGPAGPEGPTFTDDEGLLTDDARGAVYTSVMQPHINDPAPHPAYDEMPDLVTYFENGLV
jgi:hypothetical protein